MLKRLCAVLCGALLVAASAFAQSGDGTVLGTVLDASGAGVPNAEVQLLNANTGVKNSTKTDTNGSYRFNNILIGNYSVTATAPGFTTTTIKDLQVELNKATTANIKVDGVGKITTDFMKVAGFPTMGFNTTSTATWGNVRMRVALVLDVTGSMADDGKMDAMKPAAKSLVDQLSPLAKNPGDIYISIVPFSKAG